MVDVSAKPATERVAVAEGRVVMSKATLALIAPATQKGRRARHRAHRRHHGGQAHPELIPLCHPLALSKVAVDIKPDTAARLRRRAQPSRSPARPASRWKR